MLIAPDLSCFKSYDVRGQLGVNFDAATARCIAAAYASGWQYRPTSRAPHPRP